MRTTTLALCVAALAVSSLLSVGCNDQSKAQIQALQTENATLKLDRDKALDELSKSRDDNMALRNQLDAKDRELLIAKAAAENKVVPPTATKPTPEGWEKGLYGDRVTLGTDILFASGKAVLTTEGKRKLDAIAQTIKSQYKGQQVIVYGYTDSDPIRKTKNLWEDNLDLSAARAMAVTRYLWGKGISRELLDATARGETHFISTNSSKAGKAKNRRVEILVLREGKTAPAPE